MTVRDLNNIEKNKNKISISCNLTWKALYYQVYFSRLHLLFLHKKKKEKGREVHIQTLQDSVTNDVQSHTWSIVRKHSHWYLYYKY